MRNLINAGCLFFIVIMMLGCGQHSEIIKEVDTLIEQKKYDQALSVLRRALQDDPKDKTLLRKQVLLFLKSERISYAIAAYRNLDKANPNDAVLYKAVRDQDPVVRVTAAKALGLLKEPE
ncbi:MAG: tetratricopeptide repeat protein, partial [Verrucomicrobiota bacterium]